MQDFVKFLVDNWRLILEVVLLVASFVIAVTRKRGYVFDNSNHTYARVTELILEAESIWPNGHGKEKLDYVVSHMVDQQCGGYRVDAYEKYVKNIVETILFTPEKKGESNGQKKNNA